MLIYSAGNILAYIAGAGGTHASPGVMAHFGSTITSMLALDHDIILQPPVVFPSNVCAANERRWGIYTLKYTTSGVSIKYPTGGVFSITA